MNLRSKLEVMAGVVLLGLSSFGFSIWLAEHDARIHADETVKAQKQVFDQAAAQLQTLKADQSERDRRTAATIAALEASASKQTTPAQIAAWIPKQAGFESLGTIRLAAPTPQNPAADAILTVPEAQLPALRDTIEKCQECAIKLSAAEKDLVSKDDELRLAGQQLSATGKERDAYKAQLKGGTFFARAKQAAKWIVGGIAIGAAAVCGSGHCK